MILHITKVYRTQTDKDGKPLMTKDGRPYTRIAIQAKEYGSKWVSGFGSFWNQNWKDGDQVEVDVEEKGEYLNFKKPDPIKGLIERIKKLEAEVFRVVPGIGAEDISENTQDESEDEIRPEDIPF